MDFPDRFGTLACGFCLAPSINGWRVPLNLMWIVLNGRFGLIDYDSFGELLLYVIWADK